MQRSTLPTGVKTLMSWRNRGTLTFDNPVQRSCGQWSLLQKSLLVHSMLANFPVPAVYFLKGKNGENVTVYDCLDAKQRLTSVFEFIEGGYALHAGTPEVVVDGTVYDLANMSFDELSEECKDAITGYRFSINCIEDATEDEVEEIFKRLNNSTPLSAIQKTRSVMGTNLARWMKEICNMDFFQHSINLTVAQLRREADLETLLQGMLLISSRAGDYTDWKAISTAEVTKYCEYIRSNYDDDKICEIRGVVDFLSHAFVEKHKFLKKSNIPTVILLGKVAVENNLEDYEFKAFIDVFSNCICPEYDAGTGSGNTKRVKTEMRVTAIAKKFEQYFELDDIGILDSSGVSANSRALPDKSGGVSLDGNGTGEGSADAPAEEDTKEVVDEVPEDVAETPSEESVPDDGMEVPSGEPLSEDDMEIPSGEPVSEEDDENHEPVDEAASSGGEQEAATEISEESLEDGKECEVVSDGEEDSDVSVAC